MKFDSTKKYKQKSLPATSSFPSISPADKISAQAFKRLLSGPVLVFFVLFSNLIFSRFKKLFLDIPYSGSESR